MAEYPARNPFPARGISSAEETSLAEFLRDWARRTPTAILPGVREAQRWATDYLRGFGDDRAHDGGLACLYGAHGVGKTHAARHMMAFVNDADPRAVQLYLRFQEDDFVAEYRRLVSQLPQDLLTDLSLRYLGALAGDRAGHADGPASRGAVLSVVGDDPGRVYDLFGTHQVEAGEVLEEQAKEIAAVAGSGPEFQRALSFLLRPEFSGVAYDWLCGRPISPDASRALGVSGQIDDPLTCRYGLQLLTRLVTRGGRPFVLVLDQCEKFLPEGRSSLTANIGLLQSLVEVIPQAAGLLLLVSNDAAWERVPPDLHQRIGTGACHMLPLTPDEARLVLGAYIGAARPGYDDAAIWPFTESALLELLRHSGGNLRLLLQLSWASFEVAGPLSVIDAELVTSASARHSHSPGLAELAMLVETRLLAAGLTIERTETGDGGVSFHLPDRREPRALVKLSEAVFFDDEVANAVQTVTQTRHLRAGGQPVFTALLATGYVSPPVLAGLRGAVHVVLVADGSPGFPGQLDELVERIAAMPLKDEEPAAFDDAMRAIVEHLEELNSERRAEMMILNRNLTAVSDRLEHQNLTAESERLDRQAPKEWPPKRAELAGRIAEARAARTAADWAEFRQARAEVVRERSSRLRMLAAAVAVAVVTTAVALATVSLVPIQLTVTLFAGTAVAATAAWFLWRRFAASDVRRANAPLGSRRDLDQLARELRGSADPHSADPVGRYAYALSEDPDGGYQVLTEAMLVEPLALVRQTIGRRLAVSERSPADCVAEVQRGLRERIPEVLLLLARGQRRAESDRPPRVLRDLPPELRVLVAIANPGSLELADGAVSKHPAEAALAALGVRGSRHPLARAYRDGMAEIVPIEIPSNELRATARLLSPLEQDGLGTYDWLPLVAEIDELYLFFEKLLHHQEEIRSNLGKS
ncbi:AAA family ATPase [Nonomuraea sp. NPDC049028]|uniref:AAA family ATPase n=1 Tax=Nonomuraea sp. NPDC049028 TaxID=3364348 RepID=UPI003710BD9B